MSVALASTVIGRGPPALILHGLFGSGANWRTIARRLEHRVESHLIDQRNHGRSPHARDMTYPALAADVLAYLDAHGIERTGLVGHSMGGKTAMTLALTAPERVCWLVVADIAPARSPSDHRPILDALMALPLGGLASRSAAEDRARAGDSRPRAAPVPAPERRPRRRGQPALAYPPGRHRERAAGPDRLPADAARRGLRRPVPVRARRALGLRRSAPHPTDPRALPGRVVGYRCRSRTLASRRATGRGNRAHRSVSR